MFLPAGQTGGASFTSTKVTQGLNYPDLPHRGAHRPGGAANFLLSALLTRLVIKSFDHVTLPDRMDVSLQEKVFLGLSASWQEHASPPFSGYHGDESPADSITGAVWEEGSLWTRWDCSIDVIGESRWSRITTNGFNGILGEPCHCYRIM